MKNQHLARIVTATLLVATAVHTVAIEGLNLTVQCQDVVLTWPSIEGETYIVQYRPTLDTNSTWETLTASLPAETGGTNTTFIHSNVVQMAKCMSGGGSFAALAVFNGEENSVAESTLAAASTEPLAFPPGGSGEPAPLKLYPPGFDLTGYTIVDPVSEVTVSGAAFMLASSSSLDPSGEPEEGGGATNASPGFLSGTGFYRVVRDGVYIAGLTNLTNGLLSGVVPVIFEAGNADVWGSNYVRGAIECGTLLIDGVKYAGEGVLDAPQGNPWRFEMDTGFLENGDHNIQVEVTWFDAAAVNANYLYISRRSPPVSISVSNMISYPQWEGDVGEAGIAAFYLKTVDSDAAYQLVISDVNQGHVKTFNGFATNGTIEVLWNMVDANGVTRTNADADPEFTAIAQAAGPSGTTPSKKTPPKKQRKNNWPEHGKWVVAFQDYFKFHYSEDGDMQDAINTFALTAGKYGGYLLYYPQPGQTNDIGQTYPIRFEDPAHPATNVTAQTVAKDHALLLYYLTNFNTRNFYFQGHGSPTTIAGGFPASRVKNAVKHRYRFVFMDGCLTAGGNWDKAFGINGPGRFALAYYQNNGIRPAAFCGYSTETFFSDGQPVTVGGVRYDGTIPWQKPYFIYSFLFYWDTDLMGWRLNQALEQAADDLSVVPEFPTQPGENLEIYGYDDLRIDEFNHKSDWPIPQ